MSQPAPWRKWLYPYASTVAIHREPGLGTLTARARLTFKGFDLPLPGRGDWRVRWTVDGRRVEHVAREMSRMRYLAAETLPVTFLQLEWTIPGVTEVGSWGWVGSVLPLDVPADA